MIFVLGLRLVVVLRVDKEAEDVIMSKNEDNWLANYDELKAHVIETGHFPDKHSTLNNWVRYQRKRIKAGIMPEEQKRLFIELADSRSSEHTGGRRAKSNNTENK